MYDEITTRSRSKASVKTWFAKFGKIWRCSSVDDLHQTAQFVPGHQNWVHCPAEHQGYGHWVFPVSAPSGKCIVMSAWLSFASCWRVPSQMTLDFWALSLSLCEWLQALMSIMAVIMSRLASCTSLMVVCLYSCVSSAKLCSLTLWCLVTAWRSAA